MSGETFKLTVDGQPAEGRPGETLLAVCRRAGRDIPTLCHHEALEPYAACRVCLVEVTAEGKADLVPSCQYPASEGLAVQTDSQAVRDARRVVLELLLARCPASEVVRDLAAKFGVTATPYPTDDPDQTCIMCGLCVRVCEEVLGISAVGFAGRGVEREVCPPFDESSEVCIGCGACAAVCPTGHVRSVDDGPLRRMETWKTDLELMACRTCGRLFAPVRQFEHIRPALPEHVPLEDLCPVCRRRDSARRLSEQAAVGRAIAHAGPQAGGSGKR